MNKFKTTIILTLIGMLFAGHAYSCDDDIAQSLKRAIEAQTRTIRKASEDKIRSDRRIARDRANAEFFKFDLTR